MSLSVKPIIPCLCNVTSSRPSSFHTLLRNAKIQQPLHRAPAQPLLILLLGRAPYHTSHTSSISIHAIDIRRPSRDNEHMMMVQDHIISIARPQTQFLSHIQEEGIQNFSIGTRRQISCSQTEGDILEAIRKTCVMDRRQRTPSSHTIGIATPRRQKYVPSLPSPPPNNPSRPPLSALGTT